MFAEMTPGSNLSLVVSRRGIERNCCFPYKQQNHRSEKVCSFSPSRLKVHKQKKSPITSTCLKFGSKERVRMEHREPAADSVAEGGQRRFKELASKWFLETQVPMIINNGLFPTWFMGFITRQDAEEILREKALGCFLVRLSNKAIGYILSYKGRDRCRHFVINQSETGQFVVCGDIAGHDTIPDLVEFYKKSPIEPFGEYLTSSCFEELNEEPYDFIQLCPKERPLSAVRAVKKQPHETPELQPTPPPRSSSTLELEVPPLPRRSRHLDGGPHSDHVLYAQLRKQPPRQKARPSTSPDLSPGAGPRRAERFVSREGRTARCSPEPTSVYSELELLDSRSRSLPRLDHSCEVEQPHWLGVPPSTPPRLSPKPPRQSEGAELSSRASSSHSLNHMDDSAVYYLAGRPGSPHGSSRDSRSPAPQLDGGSLYAEVTCQTPADRTYESVPGGKGVSEADACSNAYEPLEDVRRKHGPSSWGLKNDKWKKFFPETKKKW